MEASEKKDVIPITEESINLHDVLAQRTTTLLADVKQEPWSRHVTDDSPDVKDVLDHVVHSDHMDSEVGTSQPSFFCALCRSHIPMTVRQLTIPPWTGDKRKDYRRDTVQQKLLACSVYSSAVVEDMMNGDGAMVICHRHLEERNVPSFFCSLCRSHIPITVKQLVIPPKPKDETDYRRNTVLQRLLQCSVFSSSLVEEVMNEDGRIVICHRHLEERNLAAYFFCALCREDLPVTVPNLVVTADPVSKKLIHEQLLRKYCMWRVEDSLAGPSAKFLCRHHLRSKTANSGSKHVCSLCGNTHILPCNTTVIPSTPELQIELRERIDETRLSSDRLDEVFGLAQQLDKADPLRFCSDHLTEYFRTMNSVDGSEKAVPTIKKPRRIVNSEEVRAKRTARDRERRNAQKAIEMIENSPEKPVEPSEKMHNEVPEGEKAENRDAKVEKPKKKRKADSVQVKRVKHRLRYEKRKAAETEEQATERKRRAREKKRQTAVRKGKATQRRHKTKIEQKKLEELHRRRKANDKRSRSKKLREENKICASTD